MSEQATKELTVHFHNLLNLSIELMQRARRIREISSKDAPALQAVPEALFLPWQQSVIEARQWISQQAKAKGISEEPPAAIPVMSFGPGVDD